MLEGFCFRLFFYDEELVMFYSFSPMNSPDEADWPLFWVVETACYAYFREFLGKDEFADNVRVWRNLRTSECLVCNEEILNKEFKRKAWRILSSAVKNFHKYPGEHDLDECLDRKKLMSCIRRSTSFRQFLRLHFGDDLW